jgi:hypothetical protein
MFGRPVEYLRYEGSLEHMQMVAAVAEQATTGLWSFEEDTDSDDEPDMEEIVEGDPTPVQFFGASARFPFEPNTASLMPPMIPCA